MRVVDTDAPSYHSRSPRAVLSSVEAEKKQKYVGACLACHAGFTTLCFSIDGMLGTEADLLLRRLADCLCTKWERSYSVVTG